MIYKIFLVLLSLNMLATTAKASSRYLTTQYIVDSNSINNTGMNNRSSSTVSNLAKIDCIKRAISLLTNNWISKTMHLSQPTDTRPHKSAVIHSFKDIFANPGYSINWRQKSSVIKVVYSF